MKRTESAPLESPPAKAKDQPLKINVAEAAKRQEPAQPLRVLIIEDSENDALLLEIELQRAGYEPTCERVETREAMSAALARQRFDLVIADYVMPRFNGLEALALVKANGLDLPFIIVSGHITDSTAVGAMKAGAHDYVMKDNLAGWAPPCSANYAMPRDGGQGACLIRSSRSSKCFVRQSKTRFQPASQRWIWMGAKPM
jgi:PleD family two-component response regulator